MELAWRNHEDNARLTFNKTTLPIREIMIANTKKPQNSVPKSPQNPVWQNGRVQTRRYWGANCQVNAKIKKERKQNKEALPPQNQQASLMLPQKNGSGNQMLGYPVGK